MGWEYVVPGYLFAAVTLGTFIIATLRRGRSLAERLPEDKRRFLD